MTCFHLTLQRSSCSDPIECNKATRLYLALLVAARLVAARLVGIVVFAICVPNAAFCEEAWVQQAVVFDHLTIKDGLSQSSVNTLMQDRDGFIWIGTQAGLNRFDGRKFLVFSHDIENPGSLSNDWVWDIHQDHNGVIWVATDQGGLNRYDPLTQEFTSFKHDPADSSSISSDNVTVIEEDTEGNLWLGTNGGGLDRFDIEKGSFEHFVHDPNDQTSISSNRISALLHDNEGHLWVGTVDSGVDIFDSQTGVFQHFDHDPMDPRSLGGNAIRCLYRTPDGRVWIGTEKNGISIRHPNQDGFEQVRHDSADAMTISSNRISAIFSDSHGELWIGTDTGLNHYLSERNHYIRYQHQVLNQHSIIDSRISTILEDRGGVVWIGTFGGISKWNINVPYFEHIGTSESEYKLSSDIVTSFVEDHQGNYWIGTWGGGLNHLLVKEGKFIHYKSEDTDVSLINDNRVLSLFVDSKNRLWIGTRNAGLSVYDLTDKTVKSYRHDPNDHFSISSDSITKIIEDTYGSIWFATYGGGINRLQDGKFIRYVHDENPHSISDNRVVDIYIDDDGIFWLSTDGGGINRFEPTTGSAEQFRHEKGNPASLSSDNTSSFLATDTAFWIGTKSSGLNRWSLDDMLKGRNRFQHFTKNDGLASNTVYGLLDDDNGNIWFSTSKGLTKLNEATNEVKNYDTTHGLQSNEFNSGAYFKSRSGLMLFGGINGFNIFRPERMISNPHIPDIQLTDFSIFNQSVSLKQPLSEVKEITLSYRDNIIGFEFASLDFTAPGKNQFKYQLHGFDDAWVDSGTVGRAVYTNLDPGQYVFQVIGSNNDGVWNEQGKAVTLTITPPFWKTWSAYLVYFLFSCSLVYFIERFRASRLKVKAELRANERLKLYVKCMEEATDSIMITDSDGEIMYANNAIRELIDIAEDETNTDTVYELLFPDEKFRQSVIQQSNSAGRWSGEIESKRRSGVPFSAEMSLSTLHDDSGEAVAMIGIGRDVTERKKVEAELAIYRESLEKRVSERTNELEIEVFEHAKSLDKLKTSLLEKELLLKEVHHRVKNNMQVISSLLNLQLRSVDNDEFRCMVLESQQRIKSMALIHEAFYQSENLSQINMQNYMEKLTRGLNRLYVEDNALTMKVTSDGTYLAIDYAVPCGLIINELVSNALKHAFRECTEQRCVSVDFRSDDESKQYCLSVKDNGIGFPEGFDFRNTQSMGMEIVCVLTAQLAGDINLCSHDGSEFVLTFPMEPQ